MKQAVSKIVEKAFHSAAKTEGWDDDAPAFFEISTPKEEFGDFSCNVAMVLASKLKKNPRAIAERLKTEIQNEPIIAKVDIAGPGFINMTIKPERWITSLGELLADPASFGKVNIGNGAKAMVEYVSANPTGPLHIGHGRGAAFGDSLARILSWGGYDVHREYYINDVGLQMDNLGNSTLERSREILGRPFGEPAYKGEYMKGHRQGFSGEVWRRCAGQACE